MNWLTSLALAILLLSFHYDGVQSASSRSPWADPAKAGSLMNCLINKIASSNVLPQQDKEDLESIMDTLMSAIKGASAKGKSSAAQLQAINMAVASSLAEIVVAEDAGNQASIAVKTQALTGALGQCFQAVMGTVDRKFINEINDLIRMFAREAASETNEIPDQGASYGAGSSASSSYQATGQNYQASSRTAGGISTFPGTAYSGSQYSQGETSQYSGQAGSSYNGEKQFDSTTGQTSYSQASGSSNIYSQRAASATSTAATGESTGYTGTQSGSVSRQSSSGSSYGNQFGSTAGQTTFGQTSTGGQTSYRQAGGVQSGLVSRISNALANTSTMRTVLSRTVSRQTVTNVVQKTVQSLANSLGIDGNNLSRLASQAISQVPAGSDTSAYVQALSSALVNGGVLNASNIDTMGSRIVSAVLNGVSNAAQDFGINVDNSNVQSDISSSSNLISSSSSSNSYTQTAASTSNDNTSRYTGSTGYTGSMASSGSSGYTGYTGSTASTGSSGYQGNTGSTASTGSSGYTGQQYGSVSGQTSYGQTSGYTGSDAGQSGYGQSSGFTGSAGGQGAFGTTTGASAGLISRVANALANSSTMRSVLRRGVSQQIASNVVQRTAQALASTLGVDGNNLSRVALQAISQVPAGSDTSSYAQAFSSALFNAGILNASNVDSLGSRVLSGVLNGVSRAAQDLGLNVDTSNVQSDISSSSSFLSSSSSTNSYSQRADSTTSAAATRTTASTGYTGQQSGSVSGQTSYGQTSGYTGSDAGQSGYGQSSGFTGSAGGQGAFGTTTGAQRSDAASQFTSGARQSAGVSVISALNSPVGLRSGSAASRISQLASSLTNAIGPNGVDANALARNLQASVSALRSSGMSSGDAKIEVLLETVVGLLQLLSNTQIRGVNPATASSVANSAARSFELILA